MKIKGELDEDGCFSWWGSCCGVDPCPLARTDRTVLRQWGRGAVGRRRAGWTSASDSRTEVRYVLTASRYLSTVA